MLRFRRTKTGIPGLDDLLMGGIPSGRVVLVMGGPGTGKTILCGQYLINGIKRFKENGVFVTLEESTQNIREEMAQFGWDLSNLEGRNKLKIVDASPLGRNADGEKLDKMLIGGRESSLVGLIDAIRRNINKTDAKRLVVDGMAALIFQFPEENKRRSAILDLVDSLSSTKTTCLITLELKSSGIERILQPEEYLADGVILLQTYKINKTFARVIQVEKMRRSEIDHQPRPYRITNSGIEVFPKEVVF
jgi:circadian clock protein KaiC